MILNPLSDHIDEPAVSGLNHLLGKLVVGQGDSGIEAGLLGEQRVELSVQADVMRHVALVDLGEVLQFATVDLD